MYQETVTYIAWAQFWTFSVPSSRSLNLVKNFLDVTEKVGKSTQKNGKTFKYSHVRGIADVYPLLWHCKCLNTIHDVCF